MRDSITSAIIGEAGGLLSTGLNLATANYQRKQSVKSSKELMNFQNDLNIANWQRQNQYNSPVQEIARLRSAGINPDLFYSSGASGISSANIPGPSASSGMQQGSTGSFGQPTQQAMLLDSQKKLLDSQTAKNLADANQTNQLTPWVTENIKSTLALNEANAKVLNENVEKIRNETELLRWQSNITKNESQISDALRDSTIATRLSELGASKEQADVILNNFAKLYTAQINLAVAQSYASYVQSDAAASNAQTARLQYSLDKNIRDRETTVKELTGVVDRELKRANIKSLNVSNLWRTDLVNSGSFGRALHDILSIPVNALGGFFRGN